MAGRGSDRSFAVRRADGCGQNTGSCDHGTARAWPPRPAGARCGHPAARRRLVSSRANRRGPGPLASPLRSAGAARPRPIVA